MVGPRVPGDGNGSAGGGSLSPTEGHRVFTASFTAHTLSACYVGDVEGAPAGGGGTAEWGALCLAPPQPRTPGRGHSRPHSRRLPPERTVRSVVVVDEETELGRSLSRAPEWRVAGPRRTRAVGGAVPHPGGAKPAPRSCSSCLFTGGRTRAEK